MLSERHLGRSVVPRLLVILVSLWLAPTASAERFALVIGNQSYSAAVGVLHNPIKDAKFVGAALRDAGFEVEEQFDADYFNLLAAVERHARRLAAVGDRGIGFIYYSGHGAARPDTRENVLLPVDISGPNAPDFWIRALPLERIEAELSALAPDAAHIVVFDACRNELRVGARGNRNFAPVGLWPNMLVAFSTGERDIATDGDPSAIAGPYARALGQELRAARITRAPILFADVKTTFREQFVEAQEPYYIDKLSREVRFDGALRQRRERRVEPRCSEELAADLWELVERSNSLDLAQSFLRHCEGTASADRAAAWLKTIAPDNSANAPQSSSPTTEIQILSGGFDDLIANLESDDITLRRGARDALAAGGLAAVSAIVAANRTSTSYRFDLGAVVALTEILRSGKSIRGEISRRLEQKDIEWLVGLSVHSDRTMRIYASEFLYDLGDPRVVDTAIGRFVGASANGKYNLALAIKGAAPFVPRSERDRVSERLRALMTVETPKTNALLSDAIVKIP
ncbi:caspase family protein [Sinorhizobium medicae]|uniref:caspase family protein n=1 Tax=Sinorhizobium medicae TaxID=110321 RepID=UPI000FDA601D|nr:caspase family protein [Sinorhizobium medicae]RVO68796.1 caspase family protein [Sinorhizobium medicae]